MSISPVLATGHDLNDRYIIPPDQSATIVILEEYRRTTSPLSADMNTNPEQEHVSFPLTIDSDLSTKAQAILHRTCGESIDGIELEPLPRKHQAKLWIHLKATAYTMALHALILGLPAAEFGTVIHHHATPSLGA
jgi:hypothetical protein